jgi:uncharacterized protein YajQ (UPF0234 family)
MKVHLSDSSYLFELVHDLLRSGCVSRTLDEETLEVVHPDAETGDEARTELTFFLRAWESRHPGVEVRLAS